MSGASGAPDVSVPSLARVWDHLLDGKNAFQVDRDAAAQMCETFPAWRELALVVAGAVALLTIAAAFGGG